MKWPHRSQGAWSIRLWGRRLLAAWLCLLRAGAGRWGPITAGAGVELGRRRNFLLRNRVLQEELRLVFTPYHRFCPECGSVCCREREIPFSDLDRLLYGACREGAVPGGRRAAGEAVGLLSCFRAGYLKAKLRNFSSGDGPRPPGGATQAPERLPFCPALGDAGCTLPWGERPAVCVFCACPQILTAMDWPAYGRYVWGTIKYLTHLSLVLRAARPVGRRSGPGPTA